MPGRAPDAVTCPTCGDEVPMGLPRSTTLEATLEAPDAGLDREFLGDLRHKHRKVSCGAGHPVNVYFRF